MQKIQFLEANPANFNPSIRPISSIKYIVVHYTGNKGDTAENNARYFHEAKISSSAHYFVSDETIWQSVKLEHAAYAVGLGSRKEPYIKWPAMWKKITNSNSVSVEICGSKASYEGTDTTKRTAAKLVADLLHYLNLSPACVYRHYDVTGKVCPAWAVNDSLKWLEFNLWVSQYFYGEEEDVLLDTPENYNMFKTWMQRYEEEQAQLPADWEINAMAYAEANGLIKDGRPRSYITRGELAEVLRRMNAKAGTY